MIERYAVTGHVTVETYNAVQEAAEERDITVHQFVREAVTYSLEHQMDPVELLLLTLGKGPVGVLMRLPDEDPVELLKEAVFLLGHARRVIKKKRGVTWLT